MTQFQFVGARAKMTAAAGHFKRLDAALQAYKNANQDALIVEKVDGFQEISCDLPPLPHEVSIIAGETAYQLRSALDIMTCHLARLSGATDTSKTYFPMARDKAYFDSPATQRKIAALSPERRERIKALKPYEDPQLIALNALANFDRHDDLLSAIPSFKDSSWALGGPDDGGEIRAEAYFRKPLPTETGKITFMRIPVSSSAKWAHFKVNVEFVFTQEPIVGEPVMATFSAIGIRLTDVFRELEAAETP